MWQAENDRPIMAPSHLQYATWLVTSTPDHLARTLTDISREAYFARGSEMLSEAHFIFPGADPAANFKLSCERVQGAVTATRCEI
jgi:hypothetical protein